MVTAHARNCENVANFDSDKAQLVPVRLEEYAGFVFINMDPNATSVEDQLPGLGAKVLEACPEVHDLKLAARFTTRTPANWKNIVDNYHRVLSLWSGASGFLRLRSG